MLIASISLGFSLLAIILALAALGLAEQRRREAARFIIAVVEKLHSIDESVSGYNIRFVQALNTELGPIKQRVSELEESLQNVQRFVQ